MCIEFSSEMKKISRVAVCNMLNHESLFDIDYENVYSLHAPREFFRILTALGSCAPPVIRDKDLLFCHKSCDEMLLLLICNDGRTFRASDKIAMMQFTERFIKVCKDFLGKLTVSTLLANVTLLAEIVDCMLIGGFVHLTETSKIRGFLSQSYTDSSTAARPSVQPHNMTSMTLSQLSGSGYQPPNQAKVVLVAQSISAPSKEDIYVDLIETLTFKINNAGETTCNIGGILTLSNVSKGQKSVDFQLNQAYSKLIGEESFSSCVDRQQFTTQGQLRADVPLGQTSIMTYHLTSPHLPFTLEAFKGSSVGELIVTLHCAVPTSVMCLKVVVVVSLGRRSRGLLKLSNMPSHTLELRDDKQTIDWSVPEIAGQTYCTAHFKILAEGSGDYEIFSPLHSNFQFEISNYLHSGCKLTSVKVDHSKNLKKWIRHLTVAGECEIETLVK